MHGQDPGGAGQVRLCLLVEPRRKQGRCFRLAGRRVRGPPPLRGSAARQTTGASPPAAAACRRGIGGGLGSRSTMELADQEIQRVAPQVAVAISDGERQVWPPARLPPQQQLSRSA